MTTLAWMIGWPELLVIGVVLVLLFGRRLPEVGRSLGKSLVEFRKGLSGVKDEVEKDVDETDESASGPEQEKPDEEQETPENKTGD